MLVHMLGCSSYFRTDPKSDLVVVSGANAQSDLSDRTGRTASPRLASHHQQRIVGAHPNPTFTIRNADNKISANFRRLRCFYRRMTKMIGRDTRLTAQNPAVIVNFPRGKRVEPCGGDPGSLPAAGVRVDWPHDASQMQQAAQRRQGSPLLERDGKLPARQRQVRQTAGALSRRNQ